MDTRACIHNDEQFRQKCVCIHDDNTGIYIKTSMRKRRQVTRDPAT